VRLSLILPTLNERENIERFVPVLFNEVPEIQEIIVVDDDSRDGTPELVADMSAREPRLRLIRRSGAPCLTAAIQEGISEASGELIGWMDADLIILPPDVRRLIAAVRDGADVAIASRFVPGGTIKGQVYEGFVGRLHALRNLRTVEDPWTGVALSWMLNVLVLPVLVGLGVRDYTSGVVVFRRDVIRSIPLHGQHGEYFIELWAELLRRRCRVIEVGYKVQPRRYGRSKTGNNMADYARRGRAYISAGVRARKAARAG